ncbi:MAG TPA: T9SS type A sorting domain-containing protein [Bacteroidales bacterium]|nr:T9SS type A sorting domain-containing protein [Bacteroidales bacterium]HNS47732.1 T9SS type A sorting domain-containing protein [Bacteroidales bacterium]
MKKLFTFILMMGISFVLTFTVSAQNPLGFHKDAFSGPQFDRLVKHLNPEDLLAAGLPQNTLGYYWDNSWMLESHTETSYFPNGNVHVETEYDINTNEPTYRYTYTYDGTGRITQMLGETNETGSWEAEMKYSISYDANGNASEITISMWTGASWMILFGSQMTYTYTPQNWVSSITTKGYDFKNGWQWDEKDIYTLDGNGYPTQILYQDYNGGWVDSSRYININWYEYFPEIGYGSTEYFVEELWSGSSWDPNLRETAVYDLTGGWVMTREIYDGTWVNSYRETMTMENDYPKLFKYEDWIDGAWFQSSGEKYLYTFTGDNLTEEIIQDYDPGISDYVNWARFVYSDFFYTTGQNELLTEANVIVYPNPVTSEITLQLLDDGSSACYVEIMNLTGQIVFAELFDLSASKPVSIQVSSLPDGMYVLQVRTNDQLLTKKFLKK